MTERASASTHPWGTSGRALAPVLFATTLTAMLGFYTIGAKSLWRDEAISVAAAKLDWSGLWRVIFPSEANSGLYYLLLHGWLVVGTGEPAVRSLSVVFAVATVPTLYVLANKLFGSDHAALSALLLAVNAFFIRYAQEARGYTLVVFLVTASSYLFVRAMHASSPRNWVIYAMVGALSVYGHFFAALVMAAHFACAMLSPWPALPRRRPRPTSANDGFTPAPSLSRRPIAGAYALMGVLVSPLLVPVSSVSHLNWLDTPSPRDLAGAFQALSGAGGPLLLGAYFLVCCAALVVAVREGRQARAAAIREDTPPAGAHRHAVVPWRYALPLAWLFLPVLGSYVFSVLIKPVFTPRYVIVSLPALTLLAAAGVMSLRPRWLRSGGVALLVALSARGLVSWYRDAVKENWRDATTYVVERTEPGDGVVFHSTGTRAPFDYYVEELRVRSRAPQPMRPSAAWGAMDLLGPDSTQGLAEWLERAQYERPRVWLVLKNRVPLPERFEQRYCAVDERSFSGVHVLLYRKRPCA